jgi:TolB protein
MYSIISTRLFFILHLLSYTYLGAQNTYSETCLTQHPGNDRYGSYSPDGNKILFESDRNGNWDIFVLDLSNHALSTIKATSLDERRPSWHPNGQQILFESINGEQSELQLFDLVSGQTSIVLAPNVLEGHYNFARFSPDGRQIAFTLMKNKQSFDLYTYHLSNRQLTRLTENGLRNAYPYWSPNGKELLCFSRKDTRNEDDEIYRIKLKNNHWKRLTNWPKHNFCPSFSTDGKKIALAISMEDSRPEIYIMNKNGKKLRRVTFNEDGETLPIWSPKGDKLLITAYRNGNFEICEISL